MKESISPGDLSVNSVLVLYIYEFLRVCRKEYYELCIKNAETLTSSFLYCTAGLDFENVDVNIEEDISKVLVISVTKFLKDPRTEFLKNLLKSHCAKYAFSGLRFSWSSHNLAQCLICAETFKAVPLCIEKYTRKNALCDF